MMEKRVTWMVSQVFIYSFRIIVEKIACRRGKIIRIVQIEKSMVMTRFLRTDRVIYSVETYNIGKI